MERKDLLLLDLCQRLYLRCNGTFHLAEWRKLWSGDKGRLGKNTCVFSDFNAATRPTPLPGIVLIWRSDRLKSSIESVPVTT